MKGFLHYINIRVFFISFLVGITFVYFLGEDIKNIIIYPNPLNLKEIQYKDKTNTCFEFNSNIVECPTDESLIKSVPIQ